MFTLGKLLSEIYRAAELSVNEGSATSHIGSLCIERVNVKPCKDLAFIDTGISKVRLRDLDYVIFVTCKIESGRRPDLAIRIERAEAVSDPYMFARCIELELARKSNTSVIVLDGVFENYESENYQRLLRSVVINCRKILVFITKHVQYMPNRECEILLLESRNIGEINYRRYAISTVGFSYLSVETLFHNDSEPIVNVLKSLQELSKTRTCPGYPLPLYIADYLSRASTRLCHIVRTLLSRTLNVVDPGLVRSVWSLDNDVSRELRLRALISHVLS